MKEKNVYTQGNQEKIRSFRLTVAHSDKLDKLAKSYYISHSELIRKLIEQAEPKPKRVK
jgi:Arc/MetJ-type ribon-helix-helix transcriptional regulator